MGVSIVIPTYKRADLLERLLKSIEQQVYKYYEVIIIDDNSPNSQEYNNLIQKYSQKINNLTYIRNSKNKGAPYSRNQGILKSKYELIALVDDDDEWLPTKLQEQVKLFSNCGPEVGIVYTWTDAINDKGELVHEFRSTIHGNAIRQMLKGCFIPSPSVMVKKDAIIKSKLFDESFPSCQDWDMWTRILNNGYSCEVVKSVQTIYHKHTRESIGSSKNARNGYKKFYKKHLKLFLKYFFKTLELKEIKKALIYIIR
ncbi:glycosyltransferase family 2 protein [Chengkuizengella marina]|uniref:Glycosyltransferase family 2 protein n=1 Tax=Chengkuizengella marina TaxID=2507566 RepID=A0A6N9Q3C9_9BACL|nr:glycosyltransferase family A protein [Chengkuizengella marina]NBI29329.1 glycosyltransferase family 2 protein [Chengkuizengella marina]